MVEMRLEKENKIFHIEMRLSLYSARCKQGATIIRDEIMDNFSLSLRENFIRAHSKLNDWKWFSFDTFCTSNLLAIPWLRRCVIWWIWSSSLILFIVSFETYMNSNWFIIRCEAYKCALSSTTGAYSEWEKVLEGV